MFEFGNWILLFSGMLTRGVWYLVTVNPCGVVYRTKWHHIPQNSNFWQLIPFIEDRRFYHLMSYSTNSRVILFRNASVAHACWFITYIMTIFSDYTFRLTKILSADKFPIVMQATITVN